MTRSYWREMGGLLRGPRRGETGGRSGAGPPRFVAGLGVDQAPPPEPSGCAQGGSAVSAGGRGLLA